MADARRRKGQDRLRREERTPFLRREAIGRIHAPPPLIGPRGRDGRRCASAHHILPRKSFTIARLSSGESFFVALDTASTTFAFFLARRPFSWSKYFFSDH